MKRSVCTILALAMLAAVAVAAFAADEKKPATTPATPDAAAQQAGMALIMPGEHHKHMEKLVGTFDYTIKMWMDPSAAPTEATGKRTAQMTLGGRYLEETYTGNFMGMPFEGHGTMAYDNVQKKYLSTWVDNMGTGIMYMEGQCDAKGPSWTMTGQMADPMSGKMVTTKHVCKIVDADHFVMEMYAPGMDGKEMKMMEISAARTK